jgi:hypothetical protein
MSTMQLNPRKTSISHKPRSINKLPNNPFNIGIRHFLRLRPNQTSKNPFNQAIPDINRHSRGCESLRKHTAVPRNAERLSSRVTDLHDGWCAVFLGCVGVFLP